MRAYIAKGGKGSWPRDNLESWLHSAAEDLTEAADALAAADAGLRACKTNSAKHRDAMGHWQGRAELAESALAQARKDALEECAKIAGACDDHVLHIYPRGPGSPPGNQLMPLRGADIAASIRALITKGETG